MSRDNCCPTGHPSGPTPCEETAPTPAVGLIKQAKGANTITDGLWLQPFLKSRPCRSLPSPLPRCGAPRRMLSFCRTSQNIPYHPPSLLSHLLLVCHFLIPLFSSLPIVPIASDLCGHSSTLAALCPCVITFPIPPPIRPPSLAPGDL